MQLRHIHIERFRGIQSLDWRIEGTILCLVGPGDSTKSTILSAIDLALSPRWRVDFNDSDFHNGDTTQPFTITVTLGDLPDTFKADSKFGLLTRGWCKDGLHDEPEDGDELVISIRLFVDRTLEPKWLIVNDRLPEEKPIFAVDREAVGVVRIGEFLDRHLTWSRGSVLSRITGKSDELNGLLAEVARAARASISADQMPKLTAATKILTDLSRAVGVRPKASFQPHLDVRSVDVNEGALSLHDGDVPIRLSGLGTRRLIALALQKHVVSGGAIALIDEIESGLEPHRLRRLLRALRDDLQKKDGAPASLGQLFMTTHSAIVVDELPCTELRIVRANDGAVSIRTIDENVQKPVRHSPEVFLGTAIIVCEGATELGFLKALDAWWSQSAGYSPMAINGTTLADGNGNHSEPYIMSMQKLGYSTAFFGDSDRPLNPSRVTLEKAGCTVIQWDGSRSLEECLAAELPWSAVLELLGLASRYSSQDVVRAAVCSTFRLDKAELRTNFEAWPESPELRSAIGLAAKKGEWFKQSDRGEEIGFITAKHLDKIPKTDLAIKLDKLRMWIDANGNS